MLNARGLPVFVSSGTCVSGLFILFLRFLGGRKIVLAGEQPLSVGSFNWLSARRTGDYARHETSLVYTGPHLSDEIEVIAASLTRRLIADAG